MSADIPKWQDSCTFSDMQYMTRKAHAAIANEIKCLRDQNADLRAEFARRDATIEKLEPLAKSAELELAAEYQKGYAAGRAVVSEGQAMCNQLWNALSLMLDTFERPIGMYANERKVCDLARTALSHPAAPAPEAPTDPETKQARLLALADRIDHEKFWRLAGMDHDKLTSDQKDRMQAGVMLRRYADIWTPGYWIVVPPTGSVQYGASTLDKAVGMAKKDESRHAAAPATEQAKAEPSPRYIPEHWQKQAHQLINELGARTVSAETAVKAILFLQLLLENGPRSAAQASPAKPDLSGLTGAALNKTIDDQMAIVDAMRHQRLERRLQNVPVENERRNGADRRTRADPIKD